MSLREARRLFTIEEYYRMAEVGILSEDDRVELIEGEVIEVTPIGGRHAACVDRLNRLLNRRIGDAAIVRVQNPVRLSKYSEPEPDVALLRPREDFYAQGHPTPEDVLLIIEVSETSLDYDRNVKMPLYARAGVPEVWLVDLSGEEIRVYSRPANSSYERVERIGRGGAVTSRTLSGLELRADEVLG